MEKKRQTGHELYAWTLVGAVFIGVIIFLLARFLYAGRASAQMQSQDKLINSVSDWANRVDSDVALAINYGELFSDMGENGYAFADDKMLIAAEYIVKRTNLSHVLFCRENGFVCDEHGKRKTDFDVSSFSGENILVSLGKSDYGEEYSDSFLIYIPMNTAGNFVVCVLNLEDVGSRFSDSYYEDVSFVALVNKKGEILNTFSRFSDTDSLFLQGDNILTNMQAGGPSKSFNTFRVKMYNGVDSAMETSYGGDQRTIAFSKLDYDEWYLAYGVRQPYVDKIIDSYFESTKSTVIKLGIVVVIFSLFIVGSTVFGHLRSRERGKELEDKADTDLLTDLNNKAATERKIQEYLESNPDARAMMFVLDIDNFKKINDTMGHAFGDTLLKTLGKEIRTEFRMTDIVGRTGGDEFMVFLKDVKDDMIVEREANRITRFFHDFKAGGDYVKYSASASIGAAIYPDDAKSFKDLYIAADQALYKAKKRGKNQLAFYNEEGRK